MCVFFFLGGGGGVFRGLGFRGLGRSSLGGGGGRVQNGLGRLEGGGVGCDGV